MATINNLRRGKRSRFERISIVDRFDLPLLFAVGALLGIGIILIYAATRDWYASFGGDPEYYLKRHSLNIIIGLLLAFGTTLIDYRLLRAYTPIIWGVSVLGLVAVLIPGIGATVNGARAWIALPGGLQIQPAELAKIAIIVGMAMVLAEKHDGNEYPRALDVLQALAVAAIPILLIVLQPDLGTTVIIGASVVTMIAVSGAQLRWSLGLLALAGFGAYVAIRLGVIAEYQLNRLQSFVDPSADPQSTGYQLRQARITIGSGGLFGKGLFEGPQTNGRFVPEQQTDFIFTVAGEELGFVGCAIIVALYTVILWRALVIARRANDLFGRLVCLGVTAWFGFQIFENIGMTLGLAPMTGVPLPLLSYGGSSMFATLIGVGLLLNIRARS
jgi:rod shape determining protein RodA